MDQWWWLDNTTFWLSNWSISKFVDCLLIHTFNFYSNQLIFCFFQCLMDIYNPISPNRCQFCLIWRIFLVKHQSKLIYCLIIAWFLGHGLKKTTLTYAIISPYFVSIVEVLYIVLHYITLVLLYMYIITPFVLLYQSHWLLCPLFIKVIKK